MDKKIIKNPNNDGVKNFTFEDFEVEIVYVEEEEPYQGNEEKIETQNFSELTAKTDEIYEDAFRKGYKDGYNKGYAEGREFGYKEGFLEGEKNAKAEYEGIIGELRSKMNEFLQNVVNAYNSWCERLEAIDEVVMSLTLEVFKFIMFTVPKEEIIKEAIKLGIGNLKDETEVKVKLNPDWLSYLGEVTLPEWIKIVPDSTLSSGTVVIEGPWGIFRSDVKERLEELRTLVLEYFDGKLGEDRSS